jgi:ribonuclease BN (tRNA processing enzyme)
MRVIVLGSGTTVPSSLRSAPGYYLECNGQEFLIDCGSGALVQLARAGRSYRTIDGVFVTHTHPDHIGDLIRLIHALKFTPGFQREQALRLFGPAGFPAFFETHVVPLVGKPGHFSVEVTEVEATFELSGMGVRTAPTVHAASLNSVSYRFEDGHRSVVFSGDCDYDRGIVELSRDTDLLVLDCSFPDALKMRGHLSASECGKVAKQANVKRLLLSHLYPVPRDQDQRLEQCRSIFDGDVRLAEDLMEIEV